MATAYEIPHSPLAEQIAQLLRTYSADLPGVSAYVRPDGETAIVYGDDPDPEATKRVTRVILRIEKEISGEGPPFILDAFYAVADETPPPGWIEAFRR